MMVLLFRNKVAKAYAKDATNDFLRGKIYDK